MLLTFFFGIVFRHSDLGEVVPERKAPERQAAVVTAGEAALWPWLGPRE